MSTNLASFDLRSFGMATFDVNASPRPIALCVAAANPKSASALMPRAKKTEAAPELLATADEAESLRMELAGLRAELQTIKDAPAAEERRRNLRDVLAADFAWRRSVR